MIELVEQRTILAVVVGSRAYGLATPESDHDRRGVYAAPTRHFWLLDKPPTHLDGPRDEQFSWEVERFCTIALQGNPTVLEVLWSPLIEHVTPLGEKLLAARGAFLSGRVAETYGSYARDQLKRVADRRLRTGETNWKQAMHMIRLLIAGTHLLRTGEVLVDVADLRDRLLAVRRGDLPWDDVSAWSADLQAGLSEAATATALPESPDRRAVDELLAAVREEGLTWLTVPEWAGDEARDLPYPLIFCTVSGAHLYGFASADSDLDLRAAHVLPLHEVVGLRTGPETIQKGGVRDGVELDVVAHDLVKFARLLTRRNGYVLEQLLSPLVVHTTDVHAELCALAPGLITRGHAHHYLGFSVSQEKLFASTGNLKPALYTLRVLLTGRHVMRTGKLETDLNVLGVDLPYVADLVDLKRDAEYSPFPQELRDRFTADVAALRVSLEEARDASALPDAPDPAAVDALDALVVRARLATGTVG